MKNRYILSVMLASLISLCANAQQNLPFNEIFTPVTGSQGTLPTGWSTGTTTGVIVLNSSVNAYSGTNGSGSAMFNLYNSGTAELPLTTTTLNNTNTSNTLKLTFDFAAAVYHSGPASLPQTYAQDRFQILASDDDGLTFTLVKDYLIGDQGELNTGGNKG